ncbi:MAG: hypothetical protein JNK33_05570 [Candidatus Doudnabacteria bacterium]|nr:hypothetical protein [Candidatus Doudnabacteria bacterium]
MVNLRLVLMLLLCFCLTTTGCNWLFPETARRNAIADSGAPPPTPKFVPIAHEDPDTVCAQEGAFGQPDCRPIGAVKCTNGGCQFGNPFGVNWPEARAFFVKKAEQILPGTVYFGDSPAALKWVPEQPRPSKQ